MLQLFWILLIKILVLEFDVFKANAVNSEDFLLPPSGVSLSPINTSSLRLSWTSPIITNETLIGYNITWSGNGTAFVDNSSTTFEITNLPTPGRNYTASISAYYATQQNSEYINATSNTNPAPATSITVVSRKIDQFHLNWTNFGESTGCIAWVEQATNSTASCFNYNKTAVITNLPTPGMQYTIYIVVQSGQVNSTGSSINDTTNPSDPYNLIVTTRGTNWFDIAFDKVGYWDSCKAWADNATGSNGTCIVQSETAYISNLPIPGQQYTIHIVGTSGAFNTSIASTTQSTNPSDPYNLTVTTRGTNWFNLSFHNVGHWDSCTAWADNATGSNGTCIVQSETAFISNLPTAGKEYPIHIVGTSGTFNSSNATAVQRTSPPTPGPLYCISETNSSLTIGIGRPNGSFELDGYNIFISSTIPSFNYSITRPENATTAQPNITFIVDNLSAGVTYSINATTKISNLWSSGQSHTECTTNLNAPDAVGVGNETETTFGIAWNAPQGNFDGFNASCDGQNSAKDAFSPVYKNPKSTNRFSTVCNGLTAGAPYSVIVSTFLNQSTLTPMRPSDLVQIVTVPQPPKNVTALPIDTSSIRMQLLYGYVAIESQCTFYKILYSNRTEFVACASTSPVSHSLSSLESDSSYNISTYATSNYSNVVAATSKPIRSLAWTLAPPVTSITGNESSPWSLDVIIDPRPFPQNVFQYVILVANSTHLVQKVQITCTDGSKTALTTVNCIPNNPLSVFNSSSKCSTGFNYNITNLKPFTTYNISVQAVNPGGCSVAKSISLRTGESTPLCLNIAIVTVNVTTITVPWSAPSEPNGLITGYQVTYFPVGQDPNVTMANVTHTNETSITLVGLDAYVNYTIKVAAINDAGVGTYDGCARSVVTAQTLIGRPFEPQLNATALSPYSALINWTLSVNKKTGPETYYNLTLTDTKNSSFIITTTIAGFNNRSWFVSDLDAYWNYSVSIVAYVIDENNAELTTNGTSATVFRTLESNPGAVQSFAVRSLSTDNQCNSSKVTWEAPAERDLNGIITNYVIRWQQVSGADNGNKTVTGDLREAIVPVKPDNQRYNFMILAKTSAGEGVERAATLPSTGSCYPTQTQNVSSILVKVDSNDSTSTTNSFIVHYDPNFFQHNDNGNITHSGLFVREVADNENVKVMTETGPQSLYSNARTWSTAIKSDKIPEYLATTDNWLSAAARKKRSASSQYTIGGTSTCSKTTNQSCNGPLPSNRAYKVRAIICTGSGCYKTEDTDYVYRTKKPSSLGWIAAVVIIPIVCIVLVILIVLVIRRRRKKNKKGKNDESELPAMGNGGRNHQRFRITSKPIPIDSFIQIVGHMHRDSDLLFSDEYKEIQESSPKYPWTEAEGESMKAKNRFINILPFDTTRVHLEEFRTGSDYINANYVMSGSDHREYIAAQGPLQTTVDDFWQMVWQERSTVIVMLTNLKESGRVKCEQYWPKTMFDATPCGQVSVTMMQEQAYASYVIRHFTAKVKGESRNLTQFHFVAWPDFGVPAHSQVLMDFIRVVRQSIGPQIEPPTIVHCSAGVGRTGTFIALDRLLRQVTDAVSIDVFGTVLQLREFRCQMVQTEAQYIFIHDCMSLEIERLRNSGSTYEGVYNDAYDGTSEPLYANGNQITQELNKRNTSRPISA